MRHIRVGLVLFVMWAFQVSFFAHIRPFGVAPDLLLVAALVGGIVGGGDFGARHGFAAGLLLDLVTTTPLGLSAGIYGLAAFGIGSLARAVDSDDPRVLPVLIGASSFLAILVTGFGLAILGSEQFVEWRLVFIGAIVAISSIVLAFPVRLAYQWALTDRLGLSGRARPETSATVLN